MPHQSWIDYDDLPWPPVRDVPPPGWYLVPTTWRDVIDAAMAVGRDPFAWLAAVPALAWAEITARRSPLRAYLQRARNAAGVAAVTGYSLEPNVVYLEGTEKTARALFAYRIGMTMAEWACRGLLRLGPTVHAEAIRPLPLPREGAMAVTPIVAQHRGPAPGAGASDGPESPLRQADPGRLLRLGRLDADAMSVSLAILAARQPELFDALAGEAEAYADRAPTAEPDPFCETCGGHAGVFWTLGMAPLPAWPAQNGRGDVCDLGHPPVIGWCLPAATDPCHGIGTTGVCPACPHGGQDTPGHCRSRWPLQ